MDWNDILMAHGEEALREHIAKAEPYKPRGNEVNPAKALLQKPVKPSVPAPPAKRQSSWRRLSEIKANRETSYLIKDIFPAKGIGQIWGPPKQGKSFYVVDLVSHIARNARYRGRKVRGGTVGYYVLEGTDGFEKRMEALQGQLEALGEDVSAIPFFADTVPLELVKDHPAIIADIKENIGQPACIVIDTLNRSYTGSESDDEDMRAYINAASAVAEALNCFVLIVHHCGWDETRSRGHSSQYGNFDVIMSVKRSEDGTIAAKIEHTKDNESGIEFLSTLKRVEIGEDNEGDTISTCVLEAVEGEAEPKLKPSVSKLSATEKEFLKSFYEALTLYVHREEHGLRPHARAVPLGVVREEFARKWVSGHDDLKDKAAAKRMAWKRIVDGIRKGPFTMETVGFEEWVWPQDGKGL